MAVHTETPSTHAAGQQPAGEEARSKDKFFGEIAHISEAMIAAHGREFAMGALVLAARFIAENKQFTKSEPDHTCCGGGPGHEHHHHHPKT